ncbi:MAG: DUF885 domain-containing protein [Bacteroidetes bacterium]|nr:DUF885 domain-containing protein [Bacteroidota bacterium]
MKNINLLFAVAVILASCNSSKTKKETKSTKEEIAAESKKANEFFDRNFDASVDRHPMQQGYLGIKKDIDKWDDISDKAAIAENELDKKDLDSLKQFNYNALDKEAQISYKLFEENTKERIALFQYRFHNYPVNQEDGLHTDVPTFLINIHRVDSLQDAEAYINRLLKVAPLFDELIVGIKMREEKNIIPPKFVFPLVIGSCKNIISGEPFEKSAKINDLMQDFTTKVNALKSIDETKKKDLLVRAKAALLISVKPAYEKLITYMESLSKKATEDAGAWKFPEGNAFYAAAIKHHTTTNMTPDEVFNLGEKEVARIHAEIHVIMKKTKFKNDNIQDFFKFMTTDKQFYYKNDEAGRNHYLKQAEGYISNMNSRLDEIFITKPKAPLLVTRVEPYREASTGGAFYDAPSPDGSRPGRFYANLSDMNIMPVYQLEALAYHEGIPGHHMQIAIAQELKSIPKFRKFGGYTAYSEGWGLYTETLGKEMGLYTDVYQDFGRLSMELLRAARLVVDPGIHYKKWTTEQAIKYFTENTAEPQGECVKAIKRYIVWPGQATAYKVGMLKIMQLREDAKKKLGAKFSIREFHDLILTAGPVPLSVMQELVEDWVKTKSAK